MQGLVTGGAGFIGSHLVRALLARGVEVRVLDDLSTGSEANLAGLNIDLKVADVRDEAAMMTTMKDVGTVFHLAAFVSVPASVKDPVLCYQTNVLGSLNVLEAAKHHGVRRVVMASSAAVYGERSDVVSEEDRPLPVSPYADSKLAMENLARTFFRAYGLETVSLRFFNVFGPRQSPHSSYAAAIPRFIRDLIDLGQVTILGPMTGNMFQAILEAQERKVTRTRKLVAYEEFLGRLPIRPLESDWLLRSFVDEVRVPALYQIIKRLLDIMGSMLGLLICILVLPWVSLAIVIERGRPVFYKQPRLGQGGRVFQVVKFRTMRQDAEADGEARWVLEGDPRSTRVGQLLRKTHIDEFPQFWNVLIGEMSIIGPRPERPELVEKLEW